MNELEAISAWARRNEVPLLTLPHANASLDAAQAGATLIPQPDGARHSLTGAMASGANALKRNLPVIILCGAGDLAAPDEGAIRAQLAAWPLVIVRLQDLLHEPDADNENAYACDWDTTVAQSLGLPGVPLLVRSSPLDGDLAGEIADCCAAAARHRTPVCVLTTRKAMLHARDTAPPSELQLTPHAAGDDASIPPPRATTGAITEEQHHRLVAKVAAIDDIVHAESDIDPDTETLVVAFGLAAPAVRAAVQSVRNAGSRASLLILHTLWPVPEKTLKRSLTPFVRRVLVVERNPGLYARILRAVLPTAQIESLCRFDGEPVEPAQIARRITDWPCG